MTKQASGLVHKRDSTRHFLFSKTDAKNLKQKRILPRESAWRTLKQAFPEVQAGKRFVDETMERLKSISAFGAMTLCLDHLPHKKGQFDAYKEIAQTLAAMCAKENGLWGILEPGMLDCFFPEKNAAQCLRIAHSFQQTLAKRATDTVTIGIAEYPTLNYKKQQVLENTRKALVHASFFGPNSAVVFDAVSLNISGDQMYEEGEIKAAIAEFKRALAMDSSNVNVRNSLGVCYAVLGDHNKAKKEFKMAIERDPQESMALYNLGLINMLAGQRDAALDFFLKANRFTAGVFEIVYQTGRLYLERGQPEYAQQYLEQASQLKPKNGAIQRYLGECYAAMGQSQAAVAAYKKAIKQNPGDAASLSALGCLFDEQGENPEISIMFCRESVGLSPENGLFRLRLGRLYLKQDQFEKALREFETANRLGHDATEFIKKTKHQISAKAS